MGSREIANSVLSTWDGMAPRRALLSAGVDSRWLQRRLDDGSLVEPLPGVVAHTPAGTFIGRARAGLAYAGQRAWVSHASALALHTLVPVPLPSQTIHIAVPHGQRLRPPSGLVVHQRSVEPELDVIAGLPVAGAPDALADVATQARLNDVRCWAAEAVRLRVATIDGLAHAPGRTRATRWIMTTIAEELWAGAISGPEMAVWRAIKLARLPLPELNASVQTDDGTRHVDGLWRLLRLGYEIDGRSIHAQAQAFDDDRVRNNGIQSRGTLLLHFSGNQVFSALDAVIAVIEVTMRRRAEDLGVTWAAVMASGAS